MGDKTGIEWTDATWNPLAGCSIVSPGCTNCYAMKMAHRIEAMSAAQGKETHYAGTTKQSKAGAVWTGKINLAPDHILTQPIRWKRPRKIFVNSMSDLFHEDVPDEWIDQVFAVMAMSPQHVFQILTKRPERMRAYMTDPAAPARIYDRVCDMTLEGDADAVLVASSDLLAFAPAGPHVILGVWPLSNVWLGVSVEDQRRADGRIPLLLDTPAAVRFLSMEPLLGPVDLSSIDIDGESGVTPLRPWTADELSEMWGDEIEHGQAAIDWVIVGGESGPSARPMHPDWVRSIRDQCKAADVAFLFKQWGEWMPTGSVDTYSHGPNGRDRNFPQAEGLSMLADGRICLRDFSVSEHARRIREKIAINTRAIEVDDTALADFTRAVEQCGDKLGYAWMYRVGKHTAGRHLDGVTHDGYPGASQC